LGERARQLLDARFELLDASLHLRKATKKNGGLAPLATVDGGITGDEGAGIKRVGDA